MCSNWRWRDFWSVDDWRDVGWSKTKAKNSSRDDNAYIGLWKDNKNDWSCYHKTWSNWLKEKIIFFNPFTQKLSHMNLENIKFVVDKTDWNYTYYYSNMKTSTDETYGWSWQFTSPFLISDKIIEDSVRQKKSTTNHNRKCWKFMRLKGSSKINEVSSHLVSLQEFASGKVL